MEFRTNRIFNAVSHLSVPFLNFLPVLGKKNRNARDSRVLQFYHSITTTFTKIPPRFL